MVEAGLVPRKGSAVGSALQYLISGQRRVHCCGPRWPHRHALLGPPEESRIGNCGLRIADWGGGWGRRRERARARASLGQLSRAGRKERKRVTKRQTACRRRGEVANHSRAFAIETVH